MHCNRLDRMATAEPHSDRRDGRGHPGLFSALSDAAGRDLPALHIVNERLRCVPLQAVVEIAELLELAPAEVQDTLASTASSSRTSRTG